MKSLVGYTGFVGSNLYENGNFDQVYNTKNIEESFWTNPDLLVYAGISAEMFLANKMPEKDFEQIKNAIENVKKINPKFLVLISTVSVYGENCKGDENTIIDETNLTAYGKNRLYIEKWVEGNWKKYLIVRLPALYGKNIKKNFIYDYIHVIPKLLKYEKFEELYLKNQRLGDFYEKQDNGFYKCGDLTPEENRTLISFFKSVGFSALNFTDSRSKYQFYNLKFLWQHIQQAIDSDIKKLNITTEPVSVYELYEFLEGKTFVNEISAKSYDYDLRSVHAEKFGGKDGYLFTKKFVMEDIKKFVEGVKF